MDPHSALTLAAVALTGIVCQWLAWRLKLPAILFLLVAGIIAGPATGLLVPQALFGDLLFPLVSLGVAVVLFEGSLTLRLHEIKEHGRVVRNLVTLGALVTWGVITVATRYLVGFNWELAALFGAVVVVTGPTVIQPLLRTMRPTAAIASILRWEGILIDPLGALLAVLVFTVVVSGQQEAMFTVLAAMAGTGVVLGLMGSLLLAWLLRHHLLPHYLVNVATLALVLTVFTLANALSHESGLLAVTVMGMVLGNLRDVPVHEVVDFKESLSVMIVSVLFIILAARIEPTQLFALGWGALALLLVVLLVARPAAVLLSTRGSKLSRNERLMLAWIAPRGIVAAAVSALFALRLEVLGLEQAALLVPLTFWIIVGTVGIQSLTARLVADRLGVSEPEPRGVIIVGADRLARAIAAALQEQGFPVVLADGHWDHIRTARMEGFRTYFGNVASAHAERHLDLVGIGRLLAVTQRPFFNALACLSYRNEFGSDRVYALQTSEEKGSSEKQTLGPQYSCRRLFSERVTRAMLASELSRGAQIRTTRLSESFDWHAYLSRYHGKAIPLFAITPKGLLRVFSAEREIKLGPGWSVIGLVPPEPTPEGAATAAVTAAAVS